LWPSKYIVEEFLSSDRYLESQEKLLEQSTCIYFVDGFSSLLKHNYGDAVQACFDDNCFSEIYHGNEDGRLVEECLGWIAAIIFEA